MMKKNILFVCKFNRFRSKVAEAYFNKINKNPKVKAKSAGIIIGRPIDKNQKRLAKEYGIILKGKPHGLSTKLLIWQDTIIVVADDVPKSIFREKGINHKKPIIWKIKDEEKSIKLIIKKVEKLVKELK